MQSNIIPNRRPLHNVVTDVISSNWADGVVKGSTLTVSSRNGGILIAFLAWFVGVAGNAFWDLLSNVIFLARATKLERDALYHQQQLSLRLGLSGVGTLWSFWKLGLQWQHQRHTEKPWSRSLPIIFAALVWIVSFSAAGILVSRVTQTPTICGLWNDPYHLTGLTNLGETVQWQSHVEQLLNLAGSYVSTCYDFNASNAEQSCLAYGRSTLVWTVETNVQCPFAPEMCSQRKSILLDSGLVDSLQHLGINSRDRIQYRQQLHCSPLETKGYVFRTSNISDPRISTSGITEQLTNDPTLFVPSGTYFIGYQYGTNALMTFSNASSNSGYNITYIYNNYTFGFAGSTVVPTTYLWE
jgi:hypothetical protein